MPIIFKKGSSSDKFKFLKGGNKKINFLKPILINDPYFNNVSLLLHMDGENGSTVFTDNSSNNLTVTAYGDAHISTAQQKFGTSSALFDGDGDYLEVSDLVPFEFVNQDFTIECWVWFYDGGGGTTIARWDGENNAFFFYVDTSQGIIVYLNDIFISGISGGTVGSEQWYHVCLVRNGNILRTFIDGQEVGSDTFNDPINSSSTPLKIGGDQLGNTKFNGYIEELRITKGVGRYTSNFAPPVAPFPNQ